MVMFNSYVPYSMIKYKQNTRDCVCVGVWACGCVRACVRACVPVCVCMHKNILFVPYHYTFIFIKITK